MPSYLGVKSLCALLPVFTPSLAGLLLLVLDFLVSYYLCISVVLGLFIDLGFLLGWNDLDQVRSLHLPDGFLERLTVSVQSHWSVQSTVFDLWWSIESETI